jgi:hypothetical protein
LKRGRRKASPTFLFLTEVKMETVETPQEVFNLWISFQRLPPLKEEESASSFSDWLEEILNEE